MSRSIQILKLALLLVTASVMASPLFAQEQQEPQPSEPPEIQAKPKPAARGIPALDPNATVENEQQNINWQPDTSPTTGLEVPSFGAPSLAHNYWVPGLEYGSTIQSRPLGQVAQDGWYANNYVGGDLSLLQQWGHAQLGINYSGGGFFSTSNEINNGWYQQLSFAQNIQLSRWQIQFFDQFSYIPDSQFGFAGGTNLSIPGIGGSLGPSIPGLGASIVPSQSIYAALGPRYSNAFAAQVTYSFTARSSITFGGSYGLLDFTEPGNVDNDMALGSIGYNYALNKTDSIGVFYRFSAFHFNGEPQAYGNHVANFVYTKKVSRLLALSLFGGPQITTYRVPVGSQTNDVSASGGASLTYGLEHGTIRANYFHGLSGGGGVLLGSNTDEFTASLGRNIGRVWTVTVNGGYARNSAIGSSGTTPGQNYNDWFLGGGISRPFGREVNLSVSYSARFENTSQPCSGTGCNSDYTQNMVSITLQWHTRPFVLP